VSTIGEGSTGDGAPDGAAYEQIQASFEFDELRTRFRRFVFPMSAAFLLWYLAYVLLASFAKDFMSIRVPADTNLTVGLYVGLLQFVTTFLITTIYVGFANNRLDPAAEMLRTEIEGSHK
jgi:uncharacterized membrane protein (DUF485 family)